MSSTLSAISDLSIPESILQEDVTEDEEEEKFEEKVVQEESSKGKVHGSLFFNYLLAGGNVFFVMFVLFLYVLTQASASATDYFVSFWVRVEESRGNNTNLLNITDINDDVIVNNPYERFTTEFCLYVYGTLVISLFFIALTRSLLFYILAMKSSQKLHDTLFYNVINATMRFFDTNPSGRILNRFSKDIGSVDEMLPKAILDAGQILLLMMGSLFLVAVINPYFLVLVAICGFFFMLIRHVFLKSSKNIKRLEGISKS